MKGTTNSGWIFPHTSGMVWGKSWSQGPIRAVTNSECLVTVNVLVDVFLGLYVATQAYTFDSRQRRYFHMQLLSFFH